MDGIGGAGSERVEEGRAVVWIRWILVRKIVKTMNRSIFGMACLRP